MPALTEPKTWSAPSIPGLIRRKGKPKKEETPVEEKKEEAPPKVEETKVEAPPVPQEPVKLELPSDVPLNPITAHEDLMRHTIDARSLVNKIGEAAETYYFLCDYLTSEADIAPPVLNKLVDAVQAKDPNFLSELIETQANDIVDSWEKLAEIACRAAQICTLLKQQQQASVIDQELEKLDK